MAALLRRTALEALWGTWARLPPQVQHALRPAIAASRRARRRSTPPAHDATGLPADAVELDTLAGTFWFEAGDPLVTPWIREHAVWEADVVRALRRLLRPGATFVDVGAHVGFHAIVAAELVSPGGRVVAIEPVPATLALLRANVRRHGCDNVTVVGAAVSDGPRELRLAVPAVGRSGAAVSPGGDLVVSAVTLDDVVAGPVDVLKVDVEGLEPQVLGGARQLLDRNPEIVVFVEFRGGPSADGREPEEVLAFYRSLGLAPWLLAPSGALRAATPEEVVERARAEDMLNLGLRRAGQ